MNAQVQDRVFSPAFGNRPTRLVGREGILASFERALRSNPGSRDRATLLLGQRGSGKTVLLWELADRAADLGFVVATPTVASSDMLVRIVEKIQDNGGRFVKKHRTRLSGGSLGALGFSAGLQFTREVEESKSFQYKLTQLARRLTEQGYGILVLVDELQASSPEIRQLVIAYQELVGEGLDVALVMAGLPGAVSGVLNDRVLTFLNRASKIELGPLGIGDIDAFFASAFEELNVRVDANLRLELAEKTQGSPYLLQLIGHNVVIRAGGDGILNRQGAEEAIELSRVDFENDVCKTTVAALSDKDVEFLCAMAEDEGASRVADIAERMGVTPDYAQKYRRRLLDAGVVESPQRGKLAFAVPYLKSYLRRL